ncbi:MAG: acyltransferase, partial [Nonomuraea sp.]|nr:acyltransferase [Nonomuraea sp.]
QSVRAVQVVVMPVLGPLWFLAVFAALMAATPVLARFGAGLAVAAFCVVAAVDLGRFALGGPDWLGWVNLAAAWLVPYQLGIVWARGGLGARRTAWALLAGGYGGAAALVAWAGDPVSMVGVTGAALSNLSPPTLAATCLAVGQVGLALLIKEPLARLMRAPRLWKPVALLNREAMGIFLWHQTALLVVVFVTVQQYGRPDSAAWILERLALIPLVAGTLALMTWCRHRFDGRIPGL